jgi:hypothetical protein
VEVKHLVIDEEVKLNLILKEEDYFVSNGFLNAHSRGGNIKVVDGGSSDR